MTSAADLLADQLETANDRIAELEHEIDRLKSYLPWTEHYDLPDAAPDLPIPRLEIEWVERNAYDGYQWECRYVLVRRHLLGDVECVPLGSTKVGRSQPPEIGNEHMDLPFRDGVHIQWDARHLGFPAFVRYGDQVRPIDPMPDDDHRVQRLEGPDPKGP